MVFGQLQAQESLSLSDAVRFALEKQYSRRSAALESQTAEARVRESRTRFMPQLNGAFDFRDNVKRQVILLPTSAFGGPAGEFKEIRQGTQYNATASLDLSQKVLDMSNLADIRTAKESARLAALLGEQLAIEVKAAVHRAYFTVLLQQQRLRSADASVARNREALKVVQSRFENQSALRSELNRAKLNLSNAEFQYSVFTDSVASSMSYLSFLMGADPAQSWQLSDSLLLPAEISSVSEEAVSPSSRIEFKLAEQSAKIAESQIRKLKHGYIPTLGAYGFFAAQSFSESANLFQKENWFSVGYLGLRLQLPVFDGLQKAAQIKIQKLQLLKVQVTEDSVSKAVQYQVSQTSRSLRQSISGLLIQKQNMALATEILNEVKVRYENGQSLFSEVLDAESTYRDTELNYFQAVYTYLLADIEWKKARAEF